MFFCVKCDKQYNQHRNLRRHVRQVHEENTVLPSLKEEPLKWFLCSYCPRKYRTKRLLTLHITKEHDRPTTTDSKCICPLHCGFNSLRRNNLPNHLKDSHNVNVETESLQFTNYKFFLDWKEKLENDTKSRFVVSRSRGKAQLVTTHYFSCHRSGHFMSESKGLRHLKIKGSNKINAICPANIKVKENSNGECEVIFTKTHVGHKEDLGKAQQQEGQQCLIIEEEFLSAQNESQILIDQLSKKDNSKSDLSLELRKTKALKDFQELLESASSLSDMDTVDAIVAKIKSTLTAKNSEIDIFSKAQKNIPANKKVTVQRNLVSTKRKSKNYVKSKNNVNKKKKMVLSLLIKGEENDELNLDFSEGVDGSALIGRHTEPRFDLLNYILLA